MTTCADYLAIRNLQARALDLGFRLEHQHGQLCLIRSGQAVAEIMCDDVQRLTYWLDGYRAGQASR